MRNDGIEESVRAMLRARYPAVGIHDVRVHQTASPGDGIASTANRVVLEVDYDEGSEAGLPSRMMLKTIFLHRGLRFGLPAIQATGAVLRGLEALPWGSRMRPWVFSAIASYRKRYPHAPDAMYRNEARFYRELRDELILETPETFGCVIDDERRSFAVLLEDLTLRNARFPNAREATTVDEVRQLLGTLASLHAFHWGSARFDVDLRWVATPVSGGMFPVFRALGLDLIRNQVETYPYKQLAIAPLGKRVDELWAALWKAQEILASGPQTLLHGDPHIGNTYLLPNGQGGLLDWQLMVRGRWAHDVTYLMITGLETEERRAHERELLAFYLESLRAHGVASPPDVDEAWLRYRQAAIWGLVIGWLITPTENYGEAITQANLERLVAAVQDLETLRALTD
ncbi:MAG: phosphotransferase [Myxococcota bacterium]